jgi:membrane protease YdiL (CAAX protease family)
MDATEKKLSAGEKSIKQFLAISYIFTWLVWLPGILASNEIIPEIPWPPLFGIGASGPLAAAVAVTYKEGGWEQVRAWLRQGFRKKINPVWWALIITLPLLTPFISLSIFRLAGGQIAELLILEKPWIILPTFLLMVTLGGGQEEFGWRGFLLPRLLERFQPWQADLILIPTHALWHLPLFFITYTVQFQYPFWLFLVFGIGFTPLINLIFRKTGGSILAAVLFHALVNTGLDIFPPVADWVNNSPLPLIMIGIIFGISAMLINQITKPEKELN